MNNESVEIVELRKKIEESVGRVMHTPADFDFLSEPYGKGYGNISVRLR